MCTWKGEKAEKGDTVTDGETFRTALGFGIVGSRT